MLLALAARRVIEQSVAIVVAHPDDETIAAGGSMHLMPHLLLVHVTDGAPRTLGDAAREGFASPQAYGQAREAELQGALALCGADPVRVRLDVPDQDATVQIPRIAAALRDLLCQYRVGTVLTHAYEGGHPDHDATALAVHLAEPDAVVEFAGYHAAPDGGLRTGAFLPGGEEGIVVALSDVDARRKASMIACFRTQAAILSRFTAATERFRTAPRYDWTTPPHEGRLNYENWGWMSGAEWRRLAASAREAMCAA